MKIYKTTSRRYNMEIECREIGNGCAPFVIAEMSANHNGSIDNAFKIIEAAKMAGADALHDRAQRRRAAIRGQSGALILDGRYLIWAQVVQRILSV